MKDDTVSNTAPEVGDNSAFQIDFDEFRQTLDNLKQCKLEVGEASGELRTRIRAFIDGKGCNKTALQMIRQIDDMSETKRADFLRSFDSLYDMMVSEQWRDEQQAALEFED